MNTVLIGKGYWGNIVKNKLEKFTNLISILDSKSNIDDVIDNNSLDFVFICSSTNSHYELVKKIINKKINIFCEKPFTGDFFKSKELFKLAKDNNIKLYVDNIFLDRKEYLKIDKNIINKSNNIYFKWLKEDLNLKEDLINSLLYHDIYILFSLSINFEWEIEYFFMDEYILDLNLVYLDKKVKFHYNRNSRVREKTLTIDNNFFDFSKPINDPLEDIIINISNNRYIDYLYNEKITLNTLFFIKKLRNYDNK
jgi:hypothetical protein